MLIRSLERLETLAIGCQAAPERNKRRGRQNSANFASLQTARACKRARANAAGERGPSSAGTMTHRDVDSELQVSSAWLPGQIAINHISTVARHLLKAVGNVAHKSALMGDAAATLTQELGDTRLIYFL